MKSSETFNLNIQTPETGDNDEISKLKAEMLSYKPLIYDAVKRQNLKEAEELFAKAKELKEKLNDLREQAKLKENKEKGIYQIEINGEKLELGPTLGPMAWNEIPEKIDELNKSLKKDEKPWRVLTKEEFERMWEKVGKMRNEGSLLKENIESLGFKYNELYWSSSNYSSAKAWCTSLSSILYNTCEHKSEHYSVRCIR
jgi:hypothetical protein